MATIKFYDNKNSLGAKTKGEKWELDFLFYDNKNSLGAKTEGSFNVFNNMFYDNKNSLGAKTRNRLAPAVQCFTITKIL